MRRAKSDLSFGKLWPFKESNGTSSGSILIRVEEMSVIDVILIHRELDPTQTQHFGVKAAVNLFASCD